MIPWTSRRGRVCILKSVKSNSRPIVPSCLKMYSRDLLVLAASLMQSEPIPRFYVVTGPWSRSKDTLSVAVVAYPENNE